MRTALGLVFLFAAAGASAQDGAQRVTNGTQAAPGAWPDAVGVVFEGRFIECSGTLIAPDLVITARHCIDPSLSDVLIGSTDWRTNEGETIPVIERYTNPSADIAVLVLEHDSVYKPRAVAEGCVLDQYLEDGAPVAIVGYGATDRLGNVYGSKLIEAYSGVTDADCTQLNRGCQPSISPGGEIGAGGVDGDGVDACFGDSGGPLYLLTPVGDYLLGATSRAYDDVTYPCGEGGIWVRPDPVMDWVEQVTGRDVPNATCNAMPVVDGDRLKVAQGKSRSSSVKADDEEDGRDLVFAVDTPPVHGTVSMDLDGAYTYTAAADYLGADDFVVAVTDVSGYPTHTVTGMVSVEVVKHRILGCSCSSGGGAPVGFGVLTLGLVGLVSRRRKG